MSEIKLLIENHPYDQRNMAYTKLKKKLKKFKKKIETSKSILRGNTYCRRKSSAEDLHLKSHPKDYHQKLSY